MRKNKKDKQQQVYVASQWKLIMMRFRRHKLAIVGLVMLIILYFSSIFSGFIAPYSPEKISPEFVDFPPQSIHIFNPITNQFCAPFVYKYEGEMDLETFAMKYSAIENESYPVEFFVKGDTYKLFGLIETDIHLFGVEGGTIHLFGTDKMGRDLFSRTLIAGGTSLSIGLVGVMLSFVLGITMGGISGYFGGVVDVVVQRIIEFLISMPTIPIWLALSAALPANLPSTYVYFGITLILSILGWTGLARVVRGNFLAMKGEDYITAAKIMGASDGYVIRRHLIPGILSYLIVQLTLAIPTMILGETALSFLGLGIQPPSISWGVLLQDSQDLKNIVVNPWMLIPTLFVIVTVMSFNFVGDGLRDAADPYKH